MLTLRSVILKLLISALVLGSFGADVSVSTAQFSPERRAYMDPPPPLFKPVSTAQLKNLDAGIATDSASYVLRSRPVIVQAGLLGSPSGTGEIEKIPEVILLNLFDDVNLLATPDRAISQSAGRLIWYGHLTGENEGAVILTVYDDAMAGTIWSGGRHFRLIYAGDGVHIIQELQSDIPYPELEPIVPDLPSDELTPTHEMTPEALNDDGSIIDMLVVYTSAAKNAHGGTNGINALIQTAVAEANQAYTNSQIETQLRLVYSTEVTYVESGSMYTDLHRLENVDGFMDEVHDLRDAYRADLVSLIEVSSQYCGLANLMRPLSPAFEAYAFSVVASACATGYYSFAHELAHNKGSHHDRVSAGSDQGVFPYSFGYIAPDSSFRTIMGYPSPCNNCQRVQHFSNPDVLYTGQPTGIDHDINPSQSADNARSINNARTTVANFRIAISGVPGAFSKTNPSDGAAGLSNNVTLNWASSSGASTYEYCIDTIDDNSCSSNNWVDVGTNTGTIVSGLGGNSTYYWQVRGRNSNGVTEANSGDWWQFFTLSTPPGPFSKSVPVHQVNHTPTNLTLAWETSEGAAGYEVCLDQINNDVCDGSWISVGNNPSEQVIDLSPESTYYWQVRAHSGSEVTSADDSTWWSFTTTDGRSLVLVVDDDDNQPDVSAYYIDALTDLGVAYDLWDTNNSDIEPNLATLAPYAVVVWFSGDEWEDSSGPGSAAEAALADYLDAGNCLFVSSQDYYYAKGLTTFMDTYLGASLVINDVGHTQVTGMGEFSNLGTVPLNFPTDFINYTDKIYPDINANTAWQGLDNDPAGVSKDSGVYRTSFWGFPFEALFGAMTRSNALGQVLSFCSPGFTSPLVINELDAGALNAIEIYNPGSVAVDLTGWSVLNYDSSNALFSTYTFPIFTLDVGDYVAVFEGNGTDSDNVLYAGNSFSWAPDAGAAALLDPWDVAVDFVRWGSSSVSTPAGTEWIGVNATAPEAGKTLGRDETGLDTDQAVDWSSRIPSLGYQNDIFIFSHNVFLPLMVKTSTTGN